MVSRVTSLSPLNHKMKYTAMYCTGAQSALIRFPRDLSLYKDNCLVTARGKVRGGGAKSVNTVNF